MTRPPAALSSVVVATAISLPFGQSMTGVQLPGVRQSFPSSPATVLWVANGYNVSFAALLLIAGVVADRWGRRRTFAAGTWLFIATTILSALAPNVGLLVAIRITAGAAAAIQLACLPALIVAEHPEVGPDRARAFGQLGVGFGIGIGLGPLLAGVIVEAAGWRGAFLIALPFAAVTLIGTRRLQESRGESHGTRFDTTGAAIFVIALALLVYGCSEAADPGTSDAAVTIPLVLGAAAAAGFACFDVLRGRRNKPVLLPPEILTNAPFRAAVTAWWAASVGFVSLFILLPQWVDEHGGSQIVTGLLMLCLAVPMLGMPLITPRIVGRLGERFVLPGAVGAIAVGDLVASRGHPGGFPLVLVLGLCLIGLGCGTLNGLVENVALSTIPAAGSGLAAGTFQATRVTGDAFGTALAIVLVSVLGGISDALLVAAANGAVACVATVLLLRPERSRARSGESVPSRG